jgi:hypothetical protein
MPERQPRDPATRIRRILRRPGQQHAAPPPDEMAAELTSNFWRMYDQRMATVRFSDVARNFPGLVAQAVRLGWAASRTDTVVTIAGNVSCPASPPATGCSRRPGC